MKSNWSCSVIICILAMAYSPNSHAKDLGFRFNGEKCINAQGVEGMNPSFFGPCADLRGVTISKFDFSGIDFSGSKFIGADLQKSSFESAILIGVDFTNSNLSGVNFDNAQISKSNFSQALLKNVSVVEADISNSNFAKADFRLSDLSYVKSIDCNMSMVNFEGVRLDYSVFNRDQLIEANFSSASLYAANFENSNLTNANLERTNLIKANFSSARMQGTRLKDSQLRYAIFEKASLQNSNLLRLNLQNVNFKNADLSGSNIRFAKLTNSLLDGANLKDVIFDRRTELPFSKERALEFGMHFMNTKKVLIIPDVKTDSLKIFVTALEELGADVNLSTKLEFEFDGTESIQNYEAIIHMNATTAGEDIPAEGQTALNEFVKKGGVFVYGEWNSYEIGNGTMQGMRDLTLFHSEDTESETSFLLTGTEEAKGTSILDGLLTFPIEIQTSGHSIGPLYAFPYEPAVALLKDSKGEPVIAMRKFGAGTVVGFRFTCNDELDPVANCLRNSALQRLYYNAVNF